MLGDELKRARLKRGLSQEKLAFEAELDRTYISQFENNHKSPTVDVLFRICRALRAKVSELIARLEWQWEG